MDSNSLVPPTYPDRVDADEPSGNRDPPNDSVSESRRAHLHPRIGEIQSGGATLADWSDGARASEVSPHLPPSLNFRRSFFLLVKSLLTKKVVVKLSFSERINVLSMSYSLPGSSISRLRPCTGVLQS